MTDAVLTRLDAFSHITKDGFFLRATGVCLAGRGLAMIGATGSGKSGLALQMMALGARLVSDDGLWLDASNLMIRPDTAPDMIEARGIGLLQVRPVATAPLSIIVDLDRAEPDRLPPWRETAAPGGPVALILGRGHPCLAAALCQYLTHGRAK
jgi:HPr kinase/phosphorylase